MAVDYVKTGVPARMPRELAPRKWPHFMEKNYKPKEQIYTSHKVLGKLYDQVERVGFIPAFSIPFDRRVLRAYKLDHQILQDAAELKQEYDAAMRRIMAQHDIKTEFEVWSTFVIHHSNQSKDYKFHEEIGQLSSALKDQYRIECYRKAGNKDFGSMGPFVAAMYKVTEEEMNAALEDCHQVKIVSGHEEPVRKMVPESMPLISFPWLFHEILGKIANGKGFSGFDRTDGTMPLQREAKHTPPKKFRIDHGMLDEEDTLETAEGVTHRGEVLELFDKLIDYDGDEQDGDAHAVPERAATKSCSDKPPSKAPSASVDDLFFGDSASGLLPLAKLKPEGDSNSGFGSDDHANISANDEDVWSSTESGSGKLVRVYRRNQMTPPSTGAVANESLLLDFADEAGQLAINALEHSSNLNDLAEIRDMGNGEEAEDLALSRKTVTRGTASSRAVTVAEKDKSTVVVNEDMLLHGTEGPDPQKSNWSAHSELSPEAERPNSNDKEDLLDLSEEDEDEGFEEVVIQTDTKPSALHQLADLNAD